MKKTDKKTERLYINKKVNIPEIPKIENIQNT